MNIKFLICLTISACILSSCTKASKIEIHQPSKQVNNDFIWLFQDGSLVKYFSAGSSNNQKYPIPGNLQPVTYEYGKTFQISSDNEYVVWFVPSKGLVRWSNKDTSIQTFYQPTDWFYENPYFIFYGKTHSLLLVDKKGSEVIKINLDNNDVVSQSIPYPFGSIFHLSPDLTKILYIEGYRQSSGKPEYLITDIEGHELSRIRTNAEVADRTLIGWTPDSQKVFTIEDSGDIVAYDIQTPYTKSVMYSLAANERLVDFKQKDNLLFISSRNYWYLFNMNEKKIIHRLPLEAVSQLNRPTFVFSHNNDQFYIEESMTEYDASFKRLWISDWTGNKQILSPRYGITVSQQILE